jgi:hypothetical protein
MRGTYREMIAWVQGEFGFKPHDCWITHCKELAGLPVRGTYGGHRPHERQCPPDRRYAIFRAFEHFGLMRGRADERTRKG